VASQQPGSSLSNSYGEAPNDIADGLVGTRDLVTNTTAGARFLTDQPLGLHCQYARNKER
jgi:hypothetical protein